MAYFLILLFFEINRSQILLWKKEKNIFLKSYESIYRLNLQEWFNFVHTQFFLPTVLIELKVDIFDINLF